MKKLWLLALLAALAASTAAFSFYQFRGASAGEFYGTALEAPKQVSGIELTNVSGERVTFSDWRGDIVLVFFGFTNCPDVCPLTLGRLGNLYEELGAPEDVQVVMVTVDPQSDTPEIVQRYAEGFHPGFVGLGGSPSDIARAVKAFFVSAREAGDGGFVHTDAVFLLDRAGRLRLVYGQDKVMRVGEDLETILAQRDW